MSEFSRAERYLFIIALAMIVLVYFAGGVKLLQAGGPQAVNILETAQGRTSSGQYPNYPGNAPKV
jgi:hypothetical protein